TWPGDSWQHGGAPIWVTGSYDPETNLTFWGTGNPNPGWNGGPRNPGDNLYSDSVVALDADTGKLKWHYQFTPNDQFDRDPRLGLRAGARARRSRVAGQTAQGDAVGEPQRLLLRARSDDGRVPAGQAVREAELERWVREERPADSRARRPADARRDAHLSRHA